MLGFAAVRVTIASSVHVVVAPSQEQVPVDWVCGVAPFGLLLKVVGVSRV